ncbi:MAG: acetyl/propionyl-CoA carboxylase alpha subunit [Myxococcota bacterium]|jgi:acetyl/propionyl-CoA carboxylase alpha subunit
MRLLIANRGEIARRIIRAARAEGCVTIAVFSDADAATQHVSEADMAMRLGPGPAATSYLDGARILAAAAASGATAIHPGYGFLAENAEFAQSVVQAGLTWVGPSPVAMRALGDKVSARRVAAEQGVPTLLGADERDGPVDWEAAATKIGFPVLVKAAAGGGGRGMRVVNQVSELDGAMQAARREAESSFADGRLLLERFVERARHIEVQVLADNHGNAVHLYERECSVQRRRQKVWEEAPAPGLSDAMRDQLGAWSVQLATAVSYSGAGTVEFLVDGDNAFFIEMNTRIQVEHPVTEAVTGIDLVRWQIRVALGEPLSMSQEDILLTGHAIEVRLVSEDPMADWRPTTGTLVRVDLPQSHGVRIEAWAHDGTVISPHYDSLLGKVIASGRDREHARRRLIGALRNAWVTGVANNLAFLRALASHPDVAAGQVHTRWLESDSGLPSPPPEDPVLAATLATALSVSLSARHGAAPAAWRVFGRATQEDTWRVGAASLTASYISVSSGWDVTIGDTTSRIQVLAVSAGHAVVRVGSRQVSVRFVSAPVVGDPVDDAIIDDALLYLHWGDGEAVLSRMPRLPEPLTALGDADGCIAPTPGTVRAVHVDVGDEVQAGQALVTLESMKVEQTLTAPAAGVVTAVRVKVDDAVAQGERLVTLDEA